MSIRGASAIEPGVKVSFRFFTVAIAICAWIAISNHCAVGALINKAPETESECPFHSKPAKPKENSANIQCCKVLRAVVAKVSKDWARDDARFCHVELNAPLTVVFTESHNAAPLLLDTGPPGKTSFVELIGSMRAHAPPFSI